MTSDLNALPKPRVLVLSEDDLDSRLPWLSRFAGTIKTVKDLRTVDIAEWEAVITDRRLAERTTHSGLKRTVPAGVNIIALFSAATHTTFDINDPQEFDTMSILNVPGRRAVMATGTSQKVGELVRVSLLPVTRERHFQYGLSEDGGFGDSLPEKLVPFLLGPRELALAGKYSRSDGGEVWFLPTDLTHLESWFELAFEEWRQLEPEKYPHPNDWRTSPDWYSSAERAAHATRAELTAEFDRAREEFEDRLKVLSNDLEQTRVASDRQRLLLTGTGDELANEVHAALVTIGFQVANMDDLVAERERNEDFQIRSTVRSDWIAIADATGVKRGVPGSKLATIARYVTKYVAANPGSSIPHEWLIVNHWIERDPNARDASLLRSDDMDAAKVGNVLVIDTAALFLVRRAIDDNPALSEPLQRHLIETRGQFGLAEAREWLAQEH